VPALTGRVTDAAGMLTPQQRRARIRAGRLRTRTGSQIAVLLVKSTAPEAIEQYSIRVADAWKLGRKGVDDGVLLVVAKRQSEIAAPPAHRGRPRRAGRADRRAVEAHPAGRDRPALPQGDYYGGLSRASAPSPPC
jgi:uncharacterized protein